MIVTGVFSMKGNDESPLIKKTNPLIARKFILAIGLLCIGAGVLFFALTQSIFTNKFFALRAFFLIVVGAFLFYRSLTVHKNSTLFFISLVILLNSFLLMAIDIALLPFRLVQIWPFMVILCGLSLIPASFYKYGKINSRYIVPSVMITSMGVFFLLFSLDIIQMSFVAFSAQWWPLFLVIAGLLLVALFFYGKKKDSM